MVTETDEGRGLVKVYWQQIRKRVQKVEPVFAKIVDDLDPDKNFPLFLAYFPFGSLIGDTESPFLPNARGDSYRLSDNNVPREVIKHLGYGKTSCPMGMVLEKELEYFIDLRDEGITIPWVLLKPGTLFPFSRLLNKKNHRIYAPNGVLSTTSGARSIFTLPNIGCLTNHLNLQRDFNVQSPPPKTLYEHWNIFREILNSEVLENNWRSCIMYFAEKWMDKLHTDKAWLPLKSYLHDLAWDTFEYRRNQVYYDIAFSIIQKKRNLKPNPYLTDTARHLFTITLGDAPGYAPCVDDSSLPLELLQKILIESYGMKKYFPTIMKPYIYNFEHDHYPIYYSLQNPSTFAFSPKSRKISSTIFEIRELEHIMRIFTEELASEKGICSDTIMSKIAKGIKFNYYHNEEDRHQVVSPSTEVIKFDKRFMHGSSDSNFACDARFLRGCVSMRKINKVEHTMSK